MEREREVLRERFKGTTNMQTVSKNWLWDKIKLKVKVEEKVENGVGIKGKSGRSTDVGKMSEN